jgi:lambda repressor-like predicted transcriptional regulator
MTFLSDAALWFRVVQREQYATALDEAMSEAGLTNRELAFRLQDRFGTRTDASQVSRWRRGLRPSEQMQKLIARAVGRKREAIWPAN